jgi:hypothetical protein
MVVYLVGQLLGCDISDFCSAAGFPHLSPGKAVRKLSLCLDIEHISRRRRIGFWASLLHTQRNESEAFSATQRRSQESGQDCAR